MHRKPYPSDPTDAQWEELAALLPSAKPGGRPRAVDMREVMNAILYVLRSGCTWRMAPQGAGNGGERSHALSSHHRQPKREDH